MTYATLADARSQQRAHETFDDARMKRALLETSRRMDNCINVSTRYPVFEPSIETRATEIVRALVDSTRGTLHLPFYPRQLLELIGVTINGTAFATSIIDVQPFAGAGLLSPYDTLYLRDTSETWYSLVCNSSLNTFVQVVQVAGTWGVIANYARSWANTDALALGINASTTSITVADTDGIDRDGLTPRFSFGALIRIEDEMMRVIDTNATTNILTVRRGENGSAVAAHSVGSVVEYFYPDDTLRSICAAQSAMWYERLGAFSNFDLEAGAVTQYPADLLTRLINSMQLFVNGF